MFDFYWKLAQRLGLRIRTDEALPQDVASIYLDDGKNGACLILHPGLAEDEADKAVAEGLTAYVYGASHTFTACAPGKAAHLPSLRGYLLSLPSKTAADSGGRRRSPGQCRCGGAVQSRH